MPSLPNIVIVGLLSSASFLYAQDPCKCNDVRAPHHYRYAQKHETNFAKFSTASHEISPADIIGWQERYRDQTKGFRKRTVPLPRLEQSPEDSLYSLTGYMWFVKHESKGPDRDCDFHIEIGTRKKSGRRAVVEVTDDNCRLQQVILDTLESRGYKLKKEFPEGIPCTVTGLGFYDGIHPPSGHGRRGKTTFSSWEIHPVKDIVFERR